MLINEILNVNDITNDNSPLNKMINIKWRHSGSKYGDRSRSFARFYIKNKNGNTEEIRINCKYTLTSQNSRTRDKSLFVSFELVDSEGLGSYDMTNSGAASLKLGGVCRAIYEYLRDTSNDVEYIWFSAEEPSRVGTYTAIAKRLINGLFPGATIEKTNKVHNETLIFIKIK